MAEAKGSQKFEEPRLKHLEFIQNVITRMATNSFYLKGWSVTLVAATFALTITTPNVVLTLIALLPALAFWSLDAFYLREERLFRRLYDAVRSDPEAVEPFSMDPSEYKNKVDSPSEVAASTSLRRFHGAIVGVVVLATILRFVFTQIP